MSQHLHNLDKVLLELEISELRKTAALYADLKDNYDILKKELEGTQEIENEFRCALGEIRELAGETPAKYKKKVEKIVDGLESL